MERVGGCMYVCTCLHACVYEFLQLCVSKGVYAALCHTLLFLVHVRLSALSVMYAGFYAYHHISLYLFMHVRAVR